MATDSDKKIVLLYVLDILNEYTDNQHLMTYTDIVTKLNILYGIQPNVKSIARNIDTLIDYGYKIEKVRKNGCYLAERDFNDSEVMFLVDAVFSSRSISPADAKQLIKKLTKSCSKYDKARYKHIYKVEEISRKRSSQIFKNIGLIDDAIENGKKISFQYNEYDITKQFLPRMQGRTFIMNPYFLVNNNGKYYLVCNYDKYDNLANYKIECMSNIAILQEDVKPLKSLPNMEHFNQDEYINEHIYMTTGDSVDVILKLNTAKTINDVIDWFGDKVNIYQKQDDIYASFKVNEQALIYWAIQYGTNVEVVSPLDTRDKIKQTLNNILNKYL